MLASRIATIGLFALGSLALLHCTTGSGDATPSSGGSTPGGSSDAGALGSPDAGAVSVDPSAPVTCKSDADCSQGEGCIAGVCGLPHCPEAAVASSAPLGKLYAIAPVRQVVLANASNGLAQVFDGAPLAPVTTDGAFTPSAPPTAMAAGRFGTTSATNAGLAVAQAGLNGFSVIAGPGLDAGANIYNAVLSFSPVALAARDFDADGIDEIVALGPNGELSFCTFATANCQSTTLGGTGVDVAAGDALHDGVIRAVVYSTDTGGNPTMTVWSPTVSGAPKQVGTIGTALTHVALGDVDGDGHDDVIGLADGGYLGAVSDSLHLYTFTATTVSDAAHVSVSGDSVDLDVGTFDGSKGAQITLLRSSSVVDEYTGPSFGALAVTSSVSLDDSVADATTLAVGDVRGLSAMGTLAGTPTLVQGNPTPIFAAFYPPFSATDSSGVSDVILTSTTSTTDQTNQTLSLQATATLGYSANVPAVAQGSITASLSGTLAATTSNVDTVQLAETFSLYGNSTNTADSAAVLVAATCFHAYNYVVADPGGRLAAGADGSSVTVFTPIGAERSVWALTRYNAVATALGTIPYITTKARLGAPESYPSENQTFAGQPIDVSDLVFPQLDSYEVTDSARINLHLTLSDQRVNMLAATATATLSGSATVSGVTGSSSLAVTYNESETITLGAQTDIAMDVPQLRPGATDDYAFTPVLYREHYSSMASKSGGTDDSALYVLNFSVGH